MKNNESENFDQQHFNHKDFDKSATANACMEIENNFQLVESINRARRIDGTISAPAMEDIYNQAQRSGMVFAAEWALGEVNMACLADYFNHEVEATPVPNVILDSLQTAIVNGNTLKLTSQLSRVDYVSTNKVIEALGGTWNKKQACHVFKDKDAEEVIANFLETGKLDQALRPPKSGYFPTPRMLAENLVASANITAESIVLEPEGGTGNIASVIAEVVPKNQITCYEIQPQHCDTLRKLGFIAHQADFLSVEPVRLYTAVIMNPPFEKQADIDHVLHAYKFLKPGGTLSAIMSYGTVFRSNSKTVSFRRFLEQHDAEIVEIDPGAFKESGTMVKTIQISLRVPIVAAASHQIKVEPKQVKEQFSLEFA